MFPIIVFDFVAIDFETAHDKMPCQIGIAVVKDRKITKTLSYLIQPPQNEYNSYNIKIHGITPDKTVDAPSFPEVWEKIKPYLENNVIAAHNLPFDMSVLAESLDYYNIELPKIGGLIDSMAICDNQSLEESCWRYEIDLEKHHDGECDARCCAELVLAIMEDKPMIHTGKYTNRSKKRDASPTVHYDDFEYHTPIDRSTMIQDLTAADPNNPFYDKKVVITGVFTQDRDELAHIIQKMGAKINANISCKTNYVIIGDSPGPAKMAKMKALIDEGWGIQEIYQDELNRILEEYT